MKTTHLCVGGPLSGKRRTVLHDRYFRTVVQDSLPSILQFEFTSPMAPVTVTCVEYEEQYLVDVTGRVILWVPHGQSSIETIKLLIEGFEAHHAKKTPSP